MSYAQQYYFQFTNELGQNVEVKILGNGFVGTSTTIAYGGSKPVVINYLNNSDRSIGIRGSECLFTFFSATGLTLYDLFTQDERQYLLQVYYNSALYWQGFVCSDYSSEPFDEVGKYEITLKATCGLARLSGFNFYVASGNTTLGTINLTTLLRYLFAKTGLTGNFYVGLKVTSSSFSTSLPMCDQFYVNVQRFYDSSGNPQQLDTILEDICQLFGAICFQRNGEFWIIRQNDFPNITYYTVPIASGTTSEPYTTTFTNQWVQGSNSLYTSPYTTPIMIENDQGTLYDLAYSEVKLTQDLTLLATGITDPTFANWTVGSQSVPVYWTDTFYVQPYGSTYTTSYPYNNPPVKSPYPSGGITFKGSTSLGNPYYVQSVGLNANTGDTLELLFNFLYNSDFFLVYWKVWFLDTSGNKYWLNYVSGGTTTWGTAGGAESTLPYSSSEFTSTIVGGNVQQTFTMPGCPAMGQIYLRLYGTDSRSSAYGVTLTQVLMYKVNAAGQSANSQIYDVVLSGKTYTNVLEKSISIGDTPTGLYAGAITTSAGAVTSAWQDTNYAGIPLILLTAYNTLNRYKKNYRIFSGSSKGLHYYGDSYTIQGIQGINSFLVNGSSIDLKSMEGNLTMTEYDTSIGTYTYTIYSQY